MSSRTSSSARSGSSTTRTEPDVAAPDDSCRSAPADRSLIGRPPEPEDAIVRLESVSKAFGSLHVLRSLCLDFRRGATTVILGPSGTGKSVLLKHIVGLLRPDDGKVFFENQRVDNARERDLVPIRQKIGYLFQGGALFDSMTVEQNIGFPLIEHTRLSPAERNEKVAYALNLVGLPEVGAKMPSQLSGGQQKRIALARAVVMQPALVLYDEPTTGLDPIRADLINELILVLNDELGNSSIVVTHDMASARKIADRMVLLYDGRVVCDGPPDVFERSEDHLVQNFLNGRADEQELAAIRSVRDRARAENSR